MRAALLGPCALLLAATPAAAQMREEEYRQLGLTLSVPRDWKAIPVPPSDARCVLRYVEEEGDQIYVYCFEGDRGPSPERPRPANLEDFLADGVKTGFWSIDERKAGRREEGSSTWEFTLRVQEKLPRRTGWACEIGGPSRTIAFLGLTRRPAERIALWRECVERMKVYEPTVTAEAKRWRRYYEEHPELRDPQYRLAVRARLLDGWELSDSENFVYLDGSQQGILMRHLRRKLEGIRKVYEERFPPPDDLTAVSTVRVCKDRQEYLDCGGTKDSLGYWSAANEELVLFEAGREDTLAVLYHEAFHQYVHHTIGDVRPHPWFDEGYGDFFGGARFTDEGVVTRIQPNTLRLPTIQAAIRASAHPSWRTMIQMEHGEYAGSNAALHYAMGWSMIYFLESSEAVRQHAVWPRILPRYFETLARSAPGVRSWLRSSSEEVDPEGEKIAAAARRQALLAAFTGVDLAELEAAWRAYIKQL